MVLIYMDNEEIANKVTNELYRFNMLRDNSEDTKIAVENCIKNMLDFEDKKTLERMFMEIKHQ